MWHARDRCPTRPHLASLFSLPGGGSSVGRAPGLQPGGRGFESHPLHYSIVLIRRRLSVSPHNPAPSGELLHASCLRPRRRARAICRLLFPRPSHSDIRPNGAARHVLVAPHAIQRASPNDLRIAAVNQLEERVRSLAGGDDVAALRTHLLLIIRSSPDPE